jgi:hypothetical protein
MAGTLTISTLSDGTNSTNSTQIIKGSGRAWVSYNGSTLAIANSYNVSSVTRSSTGDYTVTFTTAMPSNAYSAVATCHNPGVAVGIANFADQLASRSASSIRLVTYNDGGGVQNATIVDAAFFAY